MNQIDKNTVSAKNQLTESQFVTFLFGEETGRRVMFVGNSITRHGLAPQIGWNRDCGMAASSVDKDYVHLLVKKLRKTQKDANFCICQVAEWERNYLTGENCLSLYENARKFGADVIVMRMIENCPGKDFDSEVFEREYQKLIDYLNPNGNAQVILTTSFWKHPGDSAIEKVAKARNFPYLYLGDLGEKPEMKALGLYEHDGVANHPGDLGMETIANRIFGAIKW